MSSAGVGVNGSVEVGSSTTSRRWTASDAVLTALCIGHGLDIVSADSDFARVRELNWIDPVAR